MNSFQTGQRFPENKEAAKILGLKLCVSPYPQASGPTPVTNPPPAPMDNSSNPQQQQLQQQPGGPPPLGAPGQAPPIPGQPQQWRGPAPQQMQPPHPGQGKTISNNFIRHPQECILLLSHSS